MLVLILGLLIFLAPHSIRIFAEPLRRETIEAIGEGPWKAIYSVVSIVGLVLIVWGYGMTRAAPIELWHPPEWLRLVAVPLNLLAFILLGAFIVPAGGIKASCCSAFCSFGRLPILRPAAGAIGRKESSASPALHETTRSPCWSAQ
jgi:uncharacterized membrane protein